MTVVGLDIGSRTIALVELENDELIDAVVTDTTFDPLKRCKEIIEGRSFAALTATGYGRHLAKANFADNVITEIKAFAIGCHHYFPNCRTILDIGGQDTKAISLSASGKVVDFQMNDRCAAGTGKFLEVMARAMGIEIEDFGALALSAKSSVKISSMCTVFAESEVTGLIASNTSRAQIAKGLHEAVCERSLNLLRRVGTEDELVFAGGVANNRCLRSMLESETALKVRVPENPQIIGAVGAALSCDMAANNEIGSL